MSNLYRIIFNTPRLTLPSSLALFEMISMTMKTELLLHSDENTKGLQQRKDQLDRIIEELKEYKAGRTSTVLSCCVGPAVGNKHSEDCKDAP